MNSPRSIIIAGGFDDIRARQLRFLQEAAKLGKIGPLSHCSRLDIRFR
jgi:hypothetical protein